MQRTYRLQLLLITVLAGFFLACASEELTSAKLYIQQENWPKAEEYLLKALKVEPQNPEIPFLLGDEIYARNQDWVKMNEMFDLAMKLDPNKSIKQGPTVKEYVENARGKEWGEVFNKGVSRYNTIRDLTGSARDQALDKAIELFETAAVINAKEIRVYPILATCYLEKGDIAKTVELTDKAFAMKPDDAKTYVTIGQLYIRTKNTEKAKSSFIKALALDKDNLDARSLLAQTYYELGDIVNAKETYEAAIRLEDDKKKKADLHFNLGLLYKMLNDFDSAEDNFYLAYELNPDDVQSLIGIARTFEDAERWSKAEKFYKELIFIDPENPDHYRGMARVLIQQGKPEEATRYFEKSKKLGG